MVSAANAAATGVVKASRPSLGPRGALDAVDVDGLSALMHATLCLRARCPDRERGKTPAACFAAYERVVRGLLRAGARVEVTDKHGSNALHHASFLGHARIAAALLDSVDRPETIDAQRANGESALSVAAFRGHTSVAKLLLRAQASVNLQSPKGGSALMLWPSASESQSRSAAMEIERLRAELDGILKAATHDVGRPASRRVATMVALTLRTRGPAAPLPAT